MTYLFKVFPIIVIHFFNDIAVAQPMSYIDKNGEENLCGLIEIEDLSSSLPYSVWFASSYNELECSDDQRRWGEELKDIEVDIFLGTWCGDSKNYVPKFIHLWDTLGLERQALNLIALYHTKEKYKQGPNAEEEGMDIHRVPTFIFKRNGIELARLVERPRTSLERDLAQLAFGYPPAPSYRAAAYIQNLFHGKTVDEAYEERERHQKAIYSLMGGSSELNTLGYVYLRAGKVKEALLCFGFNIHYFPYNPTVYKSHADALLESGDTLHAIADYKKAIQIKPDYGYAIRQLDLLVE